MTLAAKVPDLFATVDKTLAAECRGSTDIGT